MGFIENSLLPNENVVHRAKLSIMALIGPAFWVVVGCLFFMLFASDSGLMCVGLLVGFFVAALGLKAIVEYLTTEFAVTDQRVIAKAGGLRQNSIELRLSQIESVSVAQGILGRVFNYGSIIVTGSGGTKGKFPMIQSPMDLRKQVNSQIAQAATGNKSF
jgi:uncharacterized membrane protein YdbT with pleckstrin-like domain